MAMLKNGPIYGYYNNSHLSTRTTDVAHLIVITGTVSAPGHPDLVTSNNPWGHTNIQTYDDFMNGIPEDTKGMTFKGALRVM